MAEKYKLPTDLGDRIDQLLAGRICTAADGSYITRSNGRRRVGRPTRYYVSHVPGREKAMIIAAQDDDEAVKIANERLGGV